MHTIFIKHCSLLLKKNYDPKPNNKMSKQKKKKKLRQLMETYLSLNIQILKKCMEME
jgi:hypothetical protein